LNFLGKTKAEHIEPIKSTLATIDSPAFELKLAGTGFFPNHRRPSVFWLGLEKQPLLTELKNTIDQALQAETGQEPEGREFIPHLTLARFRRTPFRDIITDLEDEFKKLPPVSFTASRFLLYSSELTQNGAIHTIEQEYLLK
jgi:2'-5' RNA ligase